MDNRPRAHGAGFERDPQFAIGQPFVAQGFGGAPNRKDLRMRGRIVMLARAIVRFGDHLAPTRDHRPHGHFAQCRRLRGKRQGAIHGLRKGPTGHIGTALAPGRRGCNVLDDSQARRYARRFPG